MPKVTALTCPSCGAPLPSDSLTCEFCGARVEISADGARVVLVGIACPAYGFDNAPSRSFCGRCGTSLIQKRPNCDEANAIGLQYCGGCGLTLAEARRLTLEKRVQEAKQNGWQNPPTSAHVELCEKLKSPDETLMIFIKTGSNPKLRDDESGQRWTTAFVVTDQSFMFVEPAKMGLLRLVHDAIVRRIPFEEVKSLMVDVPKVELVISFEGGEGRVSLPIEKDQQRLQGSSYWSMVCHNAARGMIYYFKPFLPPRLQQGWQDGSLLAKLLRR